MTPKEVLIAARALIAKPGGWTRGVSARNGAGHPVFSYYPEAVCFCATGAVSAVTYPEYLGAVHGSALDFLGEALPKSTPCNVPAWNDRQKDKRAVLRLFDRAIKLAA